MRPDPALEIGRLAAPEREVVHRAVLGGAGSLAAIVGRKQDDRVAVQPPGLDRGGHVSNRRVERGEHPQHVLAGALPTRRAREPVNFLPRKVHEERDGGGPMTETASRVHVTPL